jgi:hypothetical protein
MAVFNSLSKEELKSAVHAALRSWYATKGKEGNLMEELLLVQEKREEQSGASSPTNLRLATNQVLYEAIEELETQDQTSARVLRLRFADDNTLLMVAYKLNVNEYSVSRMQRKAIGKLTGIIYEWELGARETRAQQIEARLPPSTYARLFGLADAQKQLGENMIRDDRPWVVAIVGIGGIGKTSLADSVSRQIIRDFRFEDMIWLRAEPQTMSGRSLDPVQSFETLISDLAKGMGLANEASSADAALTQVRGHLKSRPYLVVVDNLETDAETAFILDHLNDLARPSKFIITTRTRPAQNASVYNFSLEELSRVDAGDLIRFHASDIGVTALESANEEDIDAVYELTGGNPLALKLVVSLLDMLPLTQVMEGLMTSRPGPIEDLYRHIYWQTWRILSPSARELLQALPLVSETGGTPEYLQKISGLTDDGFWPALQELRSRSLLEVRGTLQEKRYGVHRLTETFLRTEIIQWPENDNTD